jgi:hypothetical protein
LYRRENGLPEGWCKGLVFEGDEEAKAKQELNWLSTHSMIREYMLVAKIRKKFDDLNDEIPI